MKERKPRECPECGKTFKPMTDKQWMHVLKIHQDAKAYNPRFRTS
nr:hypothetical protein [Candidatus Freyarchaeota archaeon]